MSLSIDNDRRFISSSRDIRRHSHAGFQGKLQKLPSRIADFIASAGALADEMGVSAYVVGGFVRDLLLGVDNFDVDLVVEGDGILFAQACARRLALKVLTHRRFGTATLTDAQDAFKVDITSARREVYERPAALPVVASGGIRGDLFRRDFTINAMALGINRHSFGRLFDFYGGRKDLAAGLVRVLHEKSFRDDPTRILRAVRFEQRFNFRIEKKTLKLLKQAVRARMLHEVQKHRLRDDLIMIFKERIPFKPLQRLYALGGFSYIAPALRFHARWRDQFVRLEQKSVWFRQNLSHKRHLETYVMYLCLFFFPLALPQIRRVLFDFAFHKSESSRIVSLKENVLRVRQGLMKRNRTPSAVYRLLEPLSFEVILLLMVLIRSKRVHRRIEDFLVHYNGQRIHLKGEDLVSLGAKPGPVYTTVLKKLLYARIDARVRTKEEELALAQRILARP